MTGTALNGLGRVPGSSSPWSVRLLNELILSKVERAASETEMLSLGFNDHKMPPRLSKRQQRQLEEEQLAAQIAAKPGRDDDEEEEAVESAATTTTSAATTSLFNHVRAYGYSLLPHNLHAIYASLVQTMSQRLTATVTSQTRPPRSKART